MSVPSFLKAHAGGTQILIKVQPRASRHEIVGPLGDVLKIRIAAPPVDSAANDALLRFIADQLGCSRGMVKLLKGQTSRHKAVFVQGQNPSEVAQRLMP